MATEDWVFDSIIGFFESPLWRTPVLTFMDENCIHFDAEEENKLIYTDIHKKFRQLVETLLSIHLEELGVSQQQFMEACENTSGSPVTAGVLDQILAVDDFLSFKKLLVRRNMELEMQALSLCLKQEKQGTLTEADFEAAIKESMEGAEEDRRKKEKEDLQAAIALSLAEEHMRSLQISQEQAELEHAIALSLALEEERRRRLLLEQQLKGSISESPRKEGSSSAPVSVDRPTTPKVIERPPSAKPSNRPSSAKPSDRPSTAKTEPFSERASKAAESLRKKIQEVKDMEEREASNTNNQQQGSKVPNSQVVNVSTKSNSKQPSQPTSRPSTPASSTSNTTTTSAQPSKPVVVHGPAKEGNNTKDVLVTVDEEERKRMLEESERKRIEEEAKKRYEEMIASRKNHLLAQKDKIIAKKKEEREKALKEYNQKHNKQTQPQPEEKKEDKKTSFLLTKALAGRLKSELLEMESDQTSHVPQSAARSKVENQRTTMSK